jgi:hypothetical protein
MSLKSKAHNEKKRSRADFDSEEEDEMIRDVMERREKARKEELFLARIRQRVTEQNDYILMDEGKKLYDPFGVGKKLSEEELKSRITHKGPECIVSAVGMVMAPATDARKCVEDLIHNKIKEVGDKLRPWYPGQKFEEIAKDKEMMTELYLSVQREGWAKQMETRKAVLRVCTQYELIIERLMKIIDREQGILDDDEDEEEEEEKMK